MIDFAGLVGRFTGKGAPDGAQAGTSPAAGTDGGIATGGQFAALVSLAAQLGADQDQTKLRLVVDNGPVEAGATTDAIAGDGATAVALIDPAMSSRIAAWTGVTRDRVAAPRPVEGEIAVQAVVAVQEAGAETEDDGSLVLSDAQASGDEGSGSAKEASTSEVGPAAAAPVTANPAPTMVVAPPVTQTQGAPDAIAATETTRIRTGPKRQPESVAPIAPSRRDASQPVRKAAGRSVADGADRPVAGSTGEPKLKMADQPLPKAIQALSALPLAEAAPVAEAGASIAPPLPTEPGADPAPGSERAPNATTPQTSPSQVSSVAVSSIAEAATAGPTIAGPVASLASPRQNAPATVIATAQQALATATAHDDTESAPAATDMVRAPSEAARDVSAPDGVPLPAREQVSLPIAVAPSAAPIRSRTAPQTAPADAVTTSPVETAAAPRGEETVRPVASATTKTGDRSFAIAGDAGPVSAPLRAIVEALPPVLQSELSASAVRGTTGPSTGQALGDQVIDMGVSGQWIDRMAREIAGLADGTGHSRFTLNPPHLGRLQVDLWREQGATNVRLMTETDEAAQRLSDGRQALQSDARVAALSLGTITVEKSSGSFDTNRDQPRQGGESASQAQQQAGGGQAQGRAGSGGQGSHGQTSDWVRRIARDDANQPSDASARAPAGRAANGRVRFA